MSLTKARKASHNLSCKNKCPICHTTFGECPHTWEEAKDRLLENYVRAIIRDEIEKG